MSKAVQTREIRQPVRITARMRVGAGWSDVQILNLSSRGMMLRAARPLRRGAYLEVWRGQHVMVGRVVWAANDKVGLRTQDFVPVEAVIRGSAARAPDPELDGRCTERRSSTRPKAAAIHESSKDRGRIIEFTVIAASIGAAAFMVVDTVWGALSEPMAVAARVLAAG